MKDKPCCFSYQVSEDAYKCKYKKKCDNQRVYGEILVCNIELERFQKKSLEKLLIDEDFIAGDGI